MSALDRRAIRARVDATTPGPWRSELEAGDEWWFGSGEQAVIRYGDTGWESVMVGPGNDAAELANAEFIAAARADVPMLLDTLDTVEAALRTALDCFDECTGEYAQKLCAEDIAACRAVLVSLAPAPTPQSEQAGA